MLRCAGFLACALCEEPEPGLVRGFSRYRVTIHRGLGALLSHISKNGSVGHPADALL